MRDFSEIMPIERIEDWEQRIKRHDAFWRCEIIDRPVVWIEFPEKNSEFPPLAEKEYKSAKDLWFDVEYRAEKTLRSLMNTGYAGDALPLVCPNMGPEIFSAFFGMEMDYSETTSWGIPNMDTIDDTEHICFSRDNFYFKKLMEFSDALLKKGEGRFYTGYTDYHPGGDAIAAFRDPMNLNFDMIEAPDKVKDLTLMLNKQYFKIFDIFYSKLLEARQPVTTWMPIVSTFKWGVISNDFSCMISKQMFDEVFLPGIIEESEFFEASIYHLDGPDALRHLDSLLEIPTLNAIQWVFGAGNGPASKWMHIYKKCQDAGKGVYINLTAEEIDFFISELKPEGLWLHILSGIENAGDADAIIKKVKKWS